MKLAIQLKCSLENLTDIKPEVDFLWRFKIECTACHEQHASIIAVSDQEEEDIAGSRGSANLVMKCNFCKRDMNLNVDRSSRGVYTEEDDGKFKTMVLVECRGLDIVKWVLSDGFVGKSTASMETFEIDLGDDDFVEYDETGKVSVGITEVDTKIVKVK